MDSIFENLTPVEEFAIDLFQQCLENKQFNLLECDDIEGVFSQFLDAAIAIEKAIMANRNKVDTSGLNVFLLKRVNNL